MRKTLAVGILSAAACLSQAVAAPTRTGTTWVVTGLGEPATIASAACVGTNCPTLRDAINTALAGDTITFDNALNGKTILLTLSSDDTSAGSGEFGASAFFIAGNTLVIDGSGHNVTLARDKTQPAFRLFDVDPASSLTLRGLTLRNGLARGGNSSGGGGALGAGGAIFNQGNLVLDSCTLADNQALGGSGGVGGGGANGGGGAGQDATSADGAGPNGGVSGTPPTAAGFGGGGGVDPAFGGTGGNGGFGGGGAKSSTGGNGGFGGGGGAGSVAGRAGFGGGIGAGSAELVPRGGGGAGMGGAIFNDAGSVVLTNVTLLHNSAGGGNATSGAGNGSGLGGAIFNYVGSASLSFATLAANATAAGTGGNGGSADGGAIYSYGDSSCGVGDGNPCAGGSASLVVVNSIASGNAGTHDIVVDSTGGGSLSSGSGDLIATQGGFGGTFVTADPKLGALSPNANAPATLPIPSSSPAHDAAPNCNDAKSIVVAGDERGRTRPQGAACDIGAYEYDNDYIFANSYE